MNLTPMPDLNSGSSGQGIPGRRASAREPVTPGIAIHDEAV